MTALSEIRRRLRNVERFLTRGTRHRRRLSGIPIRIAITGTRGKTSMAAWLHEAFTERGHDTYTKVTGGQPRSLYNEETHPIERSGPVKLYETEREIRRFDPEDVIVVENQGIRGYTTRLVNADYVDPTTLVLTNVRRDHLDTLGRDHREIARALAKAVPSRTHVVSGERNDVIHAYLERELARRDATLTRAVSAADDPSPSEELLAIVDAVLDATETEPLTSSERADLRRRFSFEWAETPAGRVFNAAAANDVESTELVRRELMEDSTDPFQPLVYFRADRPGRTATFIEYLDSLADRGLIEQVRAVGAHRDAVTRALSVPVVWHDERTDSPSEVLDAALADGWPVVVMGNAAPEFTQRLEDEIETREVDVSSTLSVDDTSARH